MTWHLAVIGAGPAGMYVADAISSDAKERVQVDLIERLPTPFGLLRYGVAPDHLTMKKLTPLLQRFLDRECVRFTGNVEVGRDVTVAQLLDQYDAVVYANGAPYDRPLDLPGAELSGVSGAGTFVSWYSGHPDAARPEALSFAKAAVVIGAGNVALDVARMLVKPVDDLEYTDIPEGVRGALREAAIKDVYILARRGMTDAKFTPNELRELGKINGVDVVIRAEDFALDEAQIAEVSGDARVEKNLEVMRTLVDESTGDKPKRIHLMFHTAPVEFRGAKRLEQVLVRTTRAMGAAVEDVVLPVDIAMSAIGFQGVSVDGVPVDTITGTVSATPEGRVLRDGQVAVGEYVAGWARRGSTGVLGTNRADGILVAKAIAEDLLDNPGARPKVDEIDADLLDFSTGKQQWAAIDAAEVALGEQGRRPRTKIDTWHELNRVGRGESATQVRKLSHASH